MIIERVKSMTAQERQNWIIIGAASAFIASAVYCPHLVSSQSVRFHKEFSIDSRSVPSVPIVSQGSYVTYGLIWSAPRNSVLDFGRIAVTWMGIGAAFSLAYYFNRLQIQQGGSRPADGKVIE